MFAEIIIPLALPKNYTWRIPQHMAEQVMPGCRVEVNLGKHKKYAGVVKRLQTESPPFEPKEILNVLDATPIVQPWQLEFWSWLAQYYMCTEGEVMAAALPAHFKLSSETILILQDNAYIKTQYYLNQSCPEDLHFWEEQLVEIEKR